MPIKPKPTSKELFDQKIKDIMECKNIHKNKTYIEKMAQIEMNVTFCKLLELMPNEKNKVYKIIKMKLPERREMIAKLEEEKEEKAYQEETSSNDTESIKSESAYQFELIAVHFDVDAEDQEPSKWTIEDLYNQIAINECMNEYTEAAFNLENTINQLKSDDKKLEVDPNADINELEKEYNSLFEKEPK